jgi:4-amino-4-deoxy-L-arabinose transferase-like glycosyltransferase
MTNPTRSTYAPTPSGILRAVRTSLASLRAAVRSCPPHVAQALLVFGIALLLPLAIFTYNAAEHDGLYQFPDVRSFYRPAVSVANGNGYVLRQGEEPYFFREPATAYYYAAVVRFYELLTHRRVPEPLFGTNHWPTDPDNQRVIQLIRLSQALLHAIALVFFYLLLRHVFRNGFSFAVAVFASLYPPLALYCQQLMRENLLLAVFMPMAYFFSSHLRRPAYWKMVVVGALWGISALALQVYVLVGVFLLAFLVLMTRRKVLAARWGLVMGISFALTVLPWLHNVYKYYPDVRIARSMGCSLTTDWIRLNASLEFARSHPRALSATAGGVTAGVLATNVYGFTSKECFANTFNGSWRRTADSLDATFGRPSARDRALRYARALAFFLVLPGYQPGDWSSSRAVVAHDHGNMVAILFMYFVLSACSVVGLRTCGKRAMGILPIYLFHLSFFWILMSESRRALPVVPFFVLLGLVGLLKAVQLGFPQWKLPIYRGS